MRLTRETGLKGGNLAEAQGSQRKSKIEKVLLGDLSALARDRIEKAMISRRRGESQRKTRTVKALLGELGVLARDRVEMQRNAKE